MEVKTRNMVSMIYSTTSNYDEAHRIASKVVESKLAACVNIIPSIRSVYRWQDNIEEDDESMLVIKTTDENVEPLIKKIEELHSYDVPDIVVLPVAGGLPAYLSYVKDETL